MAVDDVFQLRGVDVVAGGDDHPLDALAEIDKAILVHVAQVAGVKPDAAVVMAAQGVGSFLGVVHVAHHDGGTGDADFALGVGRDFLGGAGGDNLIISIREGHADGAAAGIILGGQAGGGDTLGGAVALPNLLGAVVSLQKGIHLFLQFRTQAVTAGENTLQEAQILSFQVLCPEQGFKEGGHAGDQVGLLLDKGLSVDFYAELGDQDAGGTADQGGVDTDAQTKTMEYRHDGQHLHTGDIAIAGGGDGLQAQGVEVQVGKLYALGGAGGAAGVEDGTAVIKVAFVRGKNGILAGLYHIVPQSITLFRELFDGPGAFCHGIQGAQREGQLVCHFGNENFCGVLQLRENFCYLVIELVQGQNGLGFGEV